MDGWVVVVKVVLVVVLVVDCLLSTTFVDDGLLCEKFPLVESIFPVGHVEVPPHSRKKT
jgi:hypothetical protein